LIRVFRIAAAIDGLSSATRLGDAHEIRSTAVEHFFVLRVP
jgi:hypothetical protein